MEIPLDLWKYTLYKRQDDTWVKVESQDQISNDAEFHLRLARDSLDELITSTLIGIVQDNSHMQPSVGMEMYHAYRNNDFDKANSLWKPDFGEGILDLINVARYFHAKYSK